jgi:hypothetical protein
MDLMTPPRDTPSTVASTPYRKAPSLPWGPPYPIYDPYDPYTDPYNSYDQYDQNWDYMNWLNDVPYPMNATLDAMHAASVAAGMMQEGKKERKRGPRGKSSPQLSNPARPRLQELRNLPQRGLGLKWASSDRKFQVVKLTQSASSPGPAATVVRAEPDGVLECTGSKLPSLDGVKGSVVCWAVESWNAMRYEASPTQDWTETERVALDKNESGTQDEWARRFSQREKQLLVGKGTRGYRRFLRVIPKNMRKAGDPQTPRVAEQCSKRAFDGRLKQWRILLHAFSPHESDDEGDDTVKTPNPEELMKEIDKAFPEYQIPPTPPKPTLSPKSTSSPLSSRSPAGSMVGLLTPARTITPARGGETGDGTPPTVPGFPFSPAFATPQALPFNSPLAQADAPIFEAGNYGNLETLAPEFQELLEKMGSLEVQDLNKLLQEFPTPDIDSALLPTGLLETQNYASDLDATLLRAQVPEELKPIFKEAFTNAKDAFTKPHDEREVILATAARAVIGSMPPTEAAPMKVLDTLLAFLNELRLTYARPSGS